MVCGGEMVLVEAVPDETMMVSGFQHETYMCSVCADVERRFCFKKHAQQEHAVVAAITAPPLAPQAAHTQPASTPNMFRRLFSIMRTE
jgi:hypothetical protein